MSSTNIALYVIKFIIILIIKRLSNYIIKISIIVKDDKFKKLYLDTKLYRL